jgi:large subunit ribosomal protein L23
MKKVHEAHSLYDVILKPVMSEKSNNLMASGNKYTFLVHKKSNKAIISKSIEFIFNVKVVSVNVLNSKARKVRFKGVRGTQSSSKKALVTLADGYKIDFTVGE